MLLAFFQGNKTNDKKRNHSANTDKNYNGEHADRPFKYSSSFHSLATDEHRSDTDYKPLEPVAASLWEARLKSVQCMQSVAHRATDTIPSCVTVIKSAQTRVNG